MKILLNSMSPTRKKILLSASIKFIQRGPLINEEAIKSKLINKNKKPEQICQELAKIKSLSVTGSFFNYYSIGADSCLIFKNTFFSKPKTKKEAEKMFKILNGKTHKLYSSIAVSKAGKIIWKYSDFALLKLHNLNNKEIKKYLNKLKTKDMQTSGLYQIESLGIILFEKIKGDIFTILGLPILLLLNFFKKEKINAWK